MCTGDVLEVVVNKRFGLKSKYFFPTQPANCFYSTTIPVPTAKKAAAAAAATTTTSAAATHNSQLLATCSHRNYNYSCDVDNNKLQNELRNSDLRVGAQSLRTSFNPYRL